MLISISPDPDTEPIYRIGYYTKLSTTRYLAHGLQQLNQIQPNLIRSQKTQKPREKQVAIEGEENKIQWTDGEDISESNWKEKMSKATNEITETFKA